MGLIDKQDLLDKFEATHWHHPLDQDIAHECANSLPSVQSVEIICRDCKHFHKGEPYSLCQRLPYQYRIKGEDDYCSKGESIAE